MIKKYVKIFVAVLAMLAISCTTALAAGNITINTKRIYDASNNTITNLRTATNIGKVRGFEVNVTNNTDEAKDLSMIVVKYTNEKCSGVVLGEAVNVGAQSPVTISVPCTITTNKVKCIIVEKTARGLFPVSATVLETDRNGF